MGRRRGPSQLGNDILAVITAERERSGSALADPDRWLTAHAIALRIFGEPANDTQRDTNRRKVARALTALERDGKVRSVLPPKQRIYY